MKNIVKYARIISLALVVCVLLLTIGCVSVSPDTHPSTAVSSQPIFDDVTISGLVYRDERVSGRSESVSVASAYAQSQATMQGHAAAYGPTGMTTINGTGTANASGSAYGIASSASTSYEAFDNFELQNQLGRELEDAHLVRRIVSTSPIEIEGVILSKEVSTGAGQVVWDVFDSVSLLCLFGGPYFGSMEAKVQLRIRNNGELIGTWQGTGEATWQASYHLARNIPEGRRRAGILAAKLALQDAIYNLTTNPTHVKDH